MMRGFMAGTLMLLIVLSGLLFIPMVIQLMPGERPGICGRDCY